MEKKMVKPNIKLKNNDMREDEGKCNCLGGLITRVMVGLPRLRVTKPRSKAESEEFDWRMMDDCFSTHN